MSLLLILAVLIVLVRLWRDVSALERRVALLETGGAPVRSIAPVVTAPLPPPSVATPVRPPTVATPPRFAAAPSPVVAAPLPPVEKPVAMPVEIPVEIDAAWEVRIGSSWMNRLGVVVLVIGLALLLGYSMTHVGPLGRVAIGFATSASMLGMGVALERREPYRTYAYGLIGGGWAGIYFTAYAMHALPAARIVTSDLAGTLALIGVASGMVVHSLRYRSETVSALAYIAAYAPLTFTTLTSFSLVAAIPLSVTLLVVCARYEWDRLALLGIVSTYGIFAFRLIALGNQVAAPGELVVYAILAAYWLTFETADLLRGRDRESATDETLFVLNAIGSLGTVVLHTRLEADAWRVILIAACAYALSAGVRARFFGKTADEGDKTEFGSAHVASALSAGLLVAAIDLRLTGARQAIALLLEAQLLIAIAVAFGDRHLRRIGVAVAAIVTGHVLFMLPPGASVTSSPISVSLAAALVAVAWAFNHEWLRRRTIAIDVVERLYPWVSLGLAAAVVAREVPGPYQGLTLLAASLALLEIGVRRDAESRMLALVAFIVGVLMVIAEFLPPSFALSSSEPRLLVWTILPLTVASAYGFAARCSAFARPNPEASESRVAAAIALSSGTGLLALFEWHAASHPLAGPAWAASALALVVAGTLWKHGSVRWQGYALSALPAARALIELVERTPAGTVLISAGAVIGLLYALAYVSRRLRAQESVTEGERIVGIALPGVATYLLLILAWRALPGVPASGSWAAIAAVLLAAGISGARDLRGQAYAVFGLSAVALLSQMVRVSTWSPAEIGVMSLSIALFYAAGSIRLVRRRSPDTGDLEPLCQAALTVIATLLLSVFLLDVVRASLLTLTWGVEGAALLVAGFAIRDRILRLSGLTMLLFCIAKLFVYDLRELEALARIFSFVVLGLLLLAVSWVYTRYREQLRRLL